MDFTKFPEKVTLMMSGGLDSTILAALLIKENIQFNGIYIDYGQMNARNSRRILNRLTRSHNIPLEIISIPTLADSFIGNMDEEYDEYAVMLCEVDEGPLSFTPITTLAASLAASMGSDALILGYNKTDRDADEDRYQYTQLVNRHIEEMMSAPRKKPFKILTPFWDTAKGDIVELGLASDWDVNDTWSCWDNKPFHCGVCPGCIDRKDGFAESKIDDPTTYSAQ